jgi:hypothetical protein
MTETEIVVQDLRRELRWSYRDQSTSNLRALAKRLIDNKDTASIADAVKKYAAVLSAARQSANPAALERVKVSAYMLTHALRDWESAR